MAVNGRRVLHYSLTTKKTRETKGEAFDAKVLNPLRMLAHYGGVLPPPRQQFQLRLNHLDGGAVFTLQHGREGLLTCGLAWLPQAEPVVWNSLKNVAVLIGVTPGFGITPKGRAAAPQQLPWMASIQLPGWAKYPEAELAWVDPFQQAMAWVILESRIRQLGEPKK